MLKDKYSSNKITTNYLPILFDEKLIYDTFKSAQSIESAYPVLAIVTGTKPDFYKQAPLITEAVKENVPAFVIDTGQHYDEVLGHGIKEFGIENMVACNMQIRGSLMEKASELLLKFAHFGKMCKDMYPYNSILPIVHGDTLVAGITPLSWLFGLGQKVAQNEAGLRSMSPVTIKNLGFSDPTADQIECFVDSQFDEKQWFLTRDEPFPEQVDTWICSAGTQYFFAPTSLNVQNLIREGYPEENIYVVGNSVVDAIEIKRKNRPPSSIFDIYPILGTQYTSNNDLVRQEWIRVDIHRRENLTKRRFMAIIKAVIQLVEIGYKVVLIRLTATEHALIKYGLVETLDKLAQDHPHNFVQTALWKDYGHVIEFLDSGSCWLELTDSGSMQEELLYFPNVASVTVRLNTDRPETVFDAMDNILAPPLNPKWIVEIVKLADQGKLRPFTKKQKKRLYGEPGTVSQNIIKILKKYFDENSGFFPWLHNRLRFDKGNDTEEASYL